MTETKMFIESIYNKKSECYERLNKSINDYADEHNLIIKSIQYDRLDDAIISNVLFSDIPNELFLL